MIPSDRGSTVYSSLYAYDRSEAVWHDELTLTPAGSDCFSGWVTSNHARSATGTQTPAVVLPAPNVQSTSRSQHPRSLGSRGNGGQHD
jgi:hypothetical protein